VAILAYLLVLLIFDRLSEIGNNFTPEEVILLILICYSLFEGYRSLLKFSENNKFLANKKRIRLTFQLIGNILISLSIVSLGFWLYFKFYLHLTGFERELVTFLIVFSNIGLLFYLFYLSIHFLERQNQLKVQKEAITRQNIELEMELFKNRINPDFLFQSLEGIIQLIRNNNTGQAEEHVDHLALFYRKILDNRFHELPPFKDEFLKVEKYLKLQNYTQGREINFSMPKMEKDYWMVPNIPLQGIQLIESTQLISDHRKFDIQARVEAPNLILSFENNLRLKPLLDVEDRLHSIGKALSYYTDLPVLWKVKEDMGSLTIPIIEKIN